jgi:hypothetical protein
MLQDIRELEGEEYATELRRRWGGLLSYRYIGRNHSSMNTGAVDNTVRLRHDLRNTLGGLMIAPLAIASPESGALNDREHVPNPLVHSCQILDPGRDVARIEVRSSQLKQGRNMAFSRSLIVDADHPERVLAMTEGQAISLGKPPDGIDKMATPMIEVEDSPDLPPLWSIFGGAKRDDGHWILKPLTIEFGSPDGALHLGPQHIILETAAMDLVAAEAKTRALQAVSSHVMFLARGKTGPFRADGHAYAGSNGLLGAQVLLVDEGADDRPVSSASYIFRVEFE